MPGWWSANDFRHARMVLVAASAASWAARFGLTVAFCAEEPCEPITGGDLVFALVFVVGVLHLGLLISLGLELGGWPARLVGAVILLPTSIGAAAYVLVVIGPIGGTHWDFVTRVNALAFAFVHAVQLWRLAGLPIPPLHPLTAPVTDDFFHPQAAPGQRAERIAGR